MNNVQQTSPVGLERKIYRIQISSLSGIFPDIYILAFSVASYPGVPRLLSSLAVRKKSEAWEQGYLLCMVYVNLNSIESVPWAHTCRQDIHTK